MDPEQQVLLDLYSVLNAVRVLTKFGRLDLLPELLPRMEEVLTNAEHLDIDVKAYEQAQNQNHH